MNKAILEALVNERELVLIFPKEPAGCKLAFYIHRCMSVLIRSVVTEKYKHLM